MPEKHLPFMLSALATAVPGAKVNITRIIEALVIAAICAIATSYMTTQKLDMKLNQFEALREEDRALAQRDRIEIRQDIAALKDVVEDHILFQGKRTK